MSETQEFLFWFVAIKHQDVPAYIKHLDKYIDPSAQLIIAKETARGVHHQSQGEHIHVAARMGTDTYKLFHNNIHKTQMKLQCRAGGGVGKQVGRIKDVRDSTKFLAYTVKDQDGFIYSDKHKGSSGYYDKLYFRNIDLKTIQEYIEISYPKKEQWDNDLIDYIKLHTIEQTYPNLDEIENLMINFYISNSKVKRTPTRQKLKAVMLRYLMYEVHMTPQVMTLIKQVL